MTLFSGLAKTRGVLGRLFGGTRERKVTLEWLDELEEALIRADVAITLVDPVMAQARDLVMHEGVDRVPRILDAVRDALLVVFNGKESGLRVAATPPRVILIVGVNGSGKTTTAAKLAKRLALEGERPLLAAADTFRAAAIEQLQAWAERLDLPIVLGTPNGDPAAVVHDAIAAGVARGSTTVIVDTAGRLHTKGHLMEELGKIVRVASKARAGAPDEVLLVLDGTSGQNAIQQARLFTQVANVTGIVVTKLDGTAKGGAVIAIASELGLPVKFLGVGERAEDLLPMDARAFVDALLPRA